MKKFRSVICILLALAMVLVFCACNKTDGPTTESPASTTAPPAASASTPAATASAPAATTAAPSAVVPSTEPASDLEYNSKHLIKSLSELAATPHAIQPGTTFIYRADNDIPSQLPWNCSSEGWMWSNVYEGLLRTNLGDISDIRGCIAETWEHSEDFLTWTFKIRDGVKFHDGTVCDAPAIVKAWGFTQEASPAYIKNQNITSWEATDAKTLVVHLSAPCSYFEVAMSNNPLMPVSPTALELYGIGDNRAAKGTGPYYIESYTSGVKIILKAFADYYLPEKYPSIETINMQVIADENTQVMAMLNGDIDCVRLKNVEQYYNLQAGGFEGFTQTTVGAANPFWFNPKKVPIFQTLEVRKAMDRFIDISAINDLVSDGLGIVNTSIWPDGTSGAVPTDQYYYDPTEGNELLASVGVAPADISFYATINPRAKQDFEVVQDQLGKSGVEMDLEVLEAEANFTLLKTGDWSLTVGSTGYSDSGPYIPWGYILPEGCMIKQCWQDVYDPELYAKMIDEYNKMKSSATWDEMLTHCKQLTVFVQEDFAAIAGYQKPEFVACTNDIKGLVFTSQNIYLQAYYLYK